MDEALILGWGWQDWLVFAAIVIAVVYLWRTRIAPKFSKQKSQVGCENCAAVGLPPETRGVTVKKLSPEESQRMRDELHTDSTSK